LRPASSTVILPPSDLLLAMTHPVSRYAIHRMTPPAVRASSRDVAIGSLYLLWASEPVLGKPPNGVHDLVRCAVAARDRDQVVLAGGVGNACQIFLQVGG